VQNLLSSSSLSINLKIKIYRTILLLVVVYGCGTRSLKLSEEHKRRGVAKRVVRRRFGPKRDEVTGNGEKYTRMSPVICTADHILFI
jgi:hypothetical protein